MLLNDSLISLSEMKWPFVFDAVVSWLKFAFLVMFVECKKAPKLAAKPCVRKIRKVQNLRQGWLKGKWLEKVAATRLWNRWHCFYCFQNILQLFVGTLIAATFASSCHLENICKNIFSQNIIFHSNQLLDFHQFEFLGLITREKFWRRDNNFY